MAQLNDGQHTIEVDDGAVSYLQSLGWQTGAGPEDAANQQVLTTYPEAQDSQFVNQPGTDPLGEALENQPAPEIEPDYGDASDAAKAEPKAKAAAKKPTAPKPVESTGGDDTN